MRNSGDLICYQADRSRKKKKKERKWISYSCFLEILHAPALGRAKTMPTLNFRHGNLNIMRDLQIKRLAIVIKGPEITGGNAALVRATSIF